MASTYLSRTNTSPTSAYKCTFSAWVKRSKLGTRQRLMTVLNPSSTGAYYFVEFTSGDNLGVNDYDGVSSGGIGGSTARKFRDINAWYHIVVAYDTTQSTGTNRIKVYVNGVEDTFNFDATGDQNRTLSASVSGKTQFIGYHGTSSMYYDGSMSHVHFVDGLTLTASTFGSTDSTTGEWKINTSPTISDYGNNGFFVLKDTNSGTDQSGKSNNLTVSGTLTKTEDCPSNVFNTYSNLYNRCNGNLSHGNTTMAQGSNSWIMSFSSIGSNSGKYYWETKYGGTYLKVGFVTDIGAGLTSSNNNYEHHADHDKGWAAYISGGNLEIRNDAAVISGYGTSDLSTSFSSGDILCLALDIDNGRFHFRKNDGSWLKSGDPVNNSGGLTIPFSDSLGNFAIPAISAYSAEGNTNFGNGYFATTAVSSAGTNASGHGIFEYDVPTGYTAWSTKGLNE